MPELVTGFALVAVVLTLDVRSRSQFEQGHTRIPGAIRVPPDRVEEWGREQEEAFGSQVEGRRVVAYCT